MTEYLESGKVYLDEALGISENTDPFELSRRWLEWKTEYPSAYNEVKVTNPIQVTTLDALATPIAVYEQTLEIVAQLNETYISAKQAYDTALNTLTGGAGATVAAAKIAVDLAVLGVKAAAKKLYDEVKEQEKKLSEIQVGADAILSE